MVFFGSHVGDFLDRIFYQNIPELIPVLWFFGGLSLLFNRNTFLGILICILSYIMAESRTIIQDGGDNIARIVLMYLLMANIKLGSIKFRNALHNLGVLSVYIQLIILYSVSGLSKVQGDYWLNGTALYYIQNVEWFSTNIHFITELLKNPWIVTFLSYTSIIYMIGFPFMLFNKFHLLWVVLGILFHIAIAISMGLIDFSLIMIGLILFTITDEEYRKLAVHFRKFSTAS